MFQPQTGSKQTPKAMTSSKIQQKAKVYPPNAAPISKRKGEMITVDTRPTQIMYVYEYTAKAVTSLLLIHICIYNYGFNDGRFTQRFYYKSDILYCAVSGVSTQNKLGRQKMKAGL